MAIDPIGVETLRYPGTTSFPFFFPSNSTFTSPATPITMFRVTLSQCGANLANNAVRLALARRIFTWQDDLQFDLSGERTERPRQQFVLANGEVGFGPATYAWEKTANPLLDSAEQVADPEGAYSWMATVCPVLNEFGLWPSQRKQYSVSVIVFYNRNMSADRELACGIIPLGGSDGWLFVPAGLAQADSVREKLMELKQSDWILLRGLKYAQMAPRSPRSVYAFKWYRVAALGDFVSATQVPGTVTACNGCRLVTLAGPDWDPSFLPANSGSTEVGLFDRIVGVYTQTVELDR